MKTESERPTLGAETGARISQLMGRTDTTTEAYLADCERCLGAYFSAIDGGFAEGLPGPIAEHLDTIEHRAAELRSALYVLPDELTALVDLHLLGSVVRRRLGHDLDTLVEPLEDLVGVLHELRQQAKADAALGPEALFERLLRALGAAYRNHFNLQPKLDPKQPFLAVLRATLVSLSPRDERIADLLGPGGESQLRALFD